MSRWLPATIALVGVAVTAAAAERAAAEAWNARLRDALGDKPCSLTAAGKASAPADRLRAWGAGHVPTGDADCGPNQRCEPATRFEITRGCASAQGSYYELAWGPNNSSFGLHRHALVFVAGDAITSLRDLVVVGDTAPTPAAGPPVDLGFDVAFSRHGAAAVAIVLEHTSATAVVDGAVAGTVPGEPQAYDVGAGARSDVLITSSGNGRTEYWHVGHGLERLGSMAWSLTAPAVDGTLPRMLVDRELAARARSWLTGIDESPEALRKLRDPEMRAETVAALTVLQTERSLIEAVKAGP